METISKNKSLISIIIFLLLMNLAMLIFFLVLNRPAQRSSYSHDQNGISGLLQNDVGFTKDQLNQYQSLRKDQFDKVHLLFEQLRKAKTDFYKLIYTPQVSDSSVNRAADLIAERQKTLDLEMLNHFKMVRNICTADQLQKFDTTIKKVISRMIGRSGRQVHAH
jgi:periplasmic protein CpxP/Spy